MYVWEDVLLEIWLGFFGWLLEVGSEIDLDSVILCLVFCDEVVLLWCVDLKFLVKGVVKCWVDGEVVIVMIISWCFWIGIVSELLVIVIYGIDM